jgi:nucleoside-diphosphate-sugar epimerase
VSDRVAVVFGGNGFIGRSLVSLLVEDGWQVRVASRQGGSPHRKAEPFRADVSDAESVKRAMEGASVVYSATTGGGAGWASFERDIVGGARNVGEASLRSGVKRLVYVSSIAALYLGRSGEVLDSEPADSRLQRRSYYARAKAMAESELLRMHKEQGLGVVIVRPGVVVGEGGMLRHSGLGVWATDLDCIGWGMGGNPLPFVLARDVAEALRGAATAPELEGLAINLAGDVRMGAREFVAEIARREGRLVRYYARPVWFLWGIDVLKWAAKVAARKEENSFPSYRDFSSRSLRSQLKCDAAKGRLGWRPVSDKGEFLRRAIDSNITPVAPGDLRSLR